MFLKRGLSGAGVRAVQVELHSRGYYGGEIDSYFGPMTEQAVRKFQLDNSLNSDGVVGPKTAFYLNSEVSKFTTVSVGEGSPATPNGLKEIKRTFGDPLEPGYWDMYCEFCPTPAALNRVFKYKNPEGKNGFYCNKLIVIPMLRALNAIVTNDLCCHIESFDGCYNVRRMRGGKRLSTHSWGIAIDLNAKQNPLGAEPKMNMEVVRHFELNGFVWGGRWKRKDGMHFQYAKGY